MNNICKTKVVLSVLLFLDNCVSCGNKVKEQLTGTVILSDFQYEQRKYRYKTEEIKNLKIKIDLECELKVSV